MVLRLILLVRVVGSNSLLRVIVIMAFLLSGKGLANPTALLLSSLMMLKQVISNIKFLNVH